MATGSESERSITPDLAAFYGADNPDYRRASAHDLFRRYLLNGRTSSVLRALDYTTDQVNYVAPTVNFLDLQHIQTRKGLQARPSRSSESSPASLVESPVLGVAEFTATLPGNLAWVAQGKMTDEEIKSLTEMGALMRVTMIDPAKITGINEGDDNNRKLLDSLHSGEEYPRLGLWTETRVTRILRSVGGVATYRTQHLENGDFQVHLTNPGSPPKLESWRKLPNDPDGLFVYGRVPRISR